LASLASQRYHNVEGEVLNRAIALDTEKRYTDRVNFSNTALASEFDAYLPRKHQTCLATILALARSGAYKSLDGLLSAIEGVFAEPSAFLQGRKGAQNDVAYLKGLQKQMQPLIAQYQLLLQPSPGTRSERCQCCLSTTRTGIIIGCPTPACKAWSHRSCLLASPVDCEEVISAGSKPVALCHACLDNKPALIEGKGKTGGRLRVMTIEPYAHELVPQTAFSHQVEQALKGRLDRGIKGGKIRCLNGYPSSLWCREVSRSRSALSWDEAITRTFGDAATSTYRGCTRHLIFGQHGVMFGAIKVQEFRSGATGERVAVLSLLDTVKCSTPRWVERVVMIIIVQELAVYYVIKKGYRRFTWLAEAPQKGRDFLLPFKFQLGEYVWKARQAAVLTFYGIVIGKDAPTKPLEAALLTHSQTPELGLIEGRQLPAQMHFGDPGPTEGGQRERRPSERNAIEHGRAAREQEKQEEERRALARAEELDLIPPATRLGSLFPLPDYTMTLYLDQSLRGAARGVEKGRDAGGREGLFKQALDEARKALHSHLHIKDTRIFHMTRAGKVGQGSQACALSIQQMLTEERKEDRNDPCVIRHPELFAEPATLKRLLEVRDPFLDY
jgi:hypothetical protein